MKFTNVHLISPGLELSDATVEVENGLIGKVSNGSPNSSDEVIDLQGQRLLPGFIDIHSHGAGGADVCDAKPSSLDQIAKLKLAEGVTTWLPTTLTQPQDKLIEIVEVLASWTPQAPLRVPGMHLEGPYINREMAGAQNPEFVRPPNLDELRKLHQIFPALILSLAPEVPGGLDLVQEACALGIIPSGAHTKADCNTTLTAAGYGMKHLTHFGNAMTGLHHREIGVLGAGLVSDSLHLELIADRVHLSEDMLELVFRNVARDRIFIITDSVASSWQPDGDSQIGGLEVIIEGGIARLKSNGALAGSTLKFNHGLRNIHEITGEPLQDLVATTSLNQANSLGLRGYGKIEVGYHADLVVLNEDFEVTQTYVGGEAQL